MLYAIPHSKDHSVNPLAFEKKKINLASICLYRISGISRTGNHRGFAWVNSAAKRHIPGKSTRETGFLTLPFKAGGHCARKTG